MKRLPTEIFSRTLPFWIEPAHVFSHTAHLPGSVLLESQPGSSDERYSVICANPFGHLRTVGGKTFISLPDRELETSDSPFMRLKDILSAYAVTSTDLIPFVGGAVGYFGYELRTFVEDSSISTADDLRMPDCWLEFYNHAAVFDHANRTISLNGLLDSQAGLASLEELILRAHSTGGKPTQSRQMRTCELSSDFTKDEYCTAVRLVKEYIAAGDIYQVNLSQRFAVPFDSDPWDTYLRLKERNPAPYAAYLNLDDFQIISSSPECFLTLNPTNQLVETRPIKGTRPRSADPAEDQRLASELLTSQKDLAENVMIVDLERNDLGRVCEFGSVSVPNLYVLESYPTVHHLVSTVTGRLRRECDAVDFLTACFPGGSITGAPKIRAMEIIDELEPVRRGVYTGSIGYLGFDGSVNLNIAIRTAVVKDDVCYFHVGGGIVADSDPEMEYQETLDKGRAFFEVLKCR